eukprot:scaffold9117_cov57-Attheya_sp.AAC.4
MPWVTKVIMFARFTCEINARDLRSPIPRRIPRRKHTGPEKFQQPAMVAWRRRRDRVSTWDALIEACCISVRSVQWVVSESHGSTPSLMQPSLGGTLEPPPMATEKLPRFRAKHFAIPMNVALSFAIIGSHLVSKCRSLYQGRIRNSQIGLALFPSFSPK